MSTKTAPAIGLFPLCLQSENITLPGAPSFKISLLVNAANHHVTGEVTITQSVTPPASHLTIQVTGSYHPLTGGPGSVISLTGYYYVSCPPPALCIIRETFVASIVLNDKGVGKGNFHWGKQADCDVPLKEISCFPK